MGRANGELEMKKRPLKEFIKMKNNGPTKTRVSSTKIV